MARVSRSAGEKYAFDESALATHSSPRIFPSSPAQATAGRCHSVRKPQPPAGSHEPDRHHFQFLPSVWVDESAPLNQRA